MENSENPVEPATYPDQPEDESGVNFIDRESIVTTTTVQTEERKEDEVSNIFKETETSTAHLMSDMPEEGVVLDEPGEKRRPSLEKKSGTVVRETESMKEEDDEQDEADGTKRDQAEDYSRFVRISEHPDPNNQKKIMEETQNEVEITKAETETNIDKAESEQKPMGYKMSTSSKQSTYSRVTIAEPPTTETEYGGGRRKSRSKKNVPKSRSIVYDITPRFRLDDDDRMTRPSGDFAVRTDADEGTEMKFYPYMDEEAEEEEEEQVEEEVEVERIDREPYYNRAEIIKEGIRIKKIRNYILQKKLAVFFKRRKMDRVLHETDQQFDTQQKYGRKLDIYGDLIERDTAQRNTITIELEDLKMRRESKLKELNELFQNMQEREKEIGLGLIDTKTGKPIPDKLVERLIRRQYVQMDEVSAMRLNFIKLKEMVLEKETAISDLDQIGDGLYLMDYEQLKVENRSHADKIEEKEEDLTRLRFKCQKTIQILAHIREKSSALDSDLDDVKEDMSMIQIENFQVRAQLNGVKQERDYYRSMTNNLQNDSGLLTQPELLRDMESSMEEYKTIYVELENLKEENKNKTRQIRNIRKNMEFSNDMGARKSYKNIFSKPITKPLLYKGRPSLCKPTISDHAFDYLINFRPKVEILNKKK